MKKGICFIAALMGVMGIAIEVLAADIGNAELAHLFSTTSNVQLVAQYAPLGSMPPEANLLSLEISPDYKRMAYVVVHEDEWFAVVDGKKSSIYTKSDCPDNACPYTKFIFSANSKRIAYVALREGRNFMVVDGKEQKSYVSGSGPVFSPDSKRIAYLAGQGKHWFVVLDGKAGKKYDLIGGFSLSFSSDSQHIAYVAQSGNKWVVVVDGKEISTYDEINEPVFSSIFSPDGKRITYAARRGNKWFVVVDGKELTSYDRVHYPCFSPDSKQVGYLAVLNNRQFVVVNDKEGNTPTDSGVTFSPDSKRVSYISNRGIVVDDKVGPAYGALSSPIFSPDSSRVAYEAWQRGQGTIVVDGKEGPWFASEGIDGPIFSPDSKRVAYISHYFDKKLGYGVADRWYVIVNEGGSYIAHESTFRLTNLSFVGERALRAVGVRGQEVMRVDIEMESR